MDLYTSGLTVSELAGRTGIGISTLRAWELRYGFPVPQRLSSGHRRYQERDVEALLGVLRDRRAGSTLQAAIARARANVAPGRSVFAVLRANLPNVAASVLSKRAMLAISRAIEDEAAGRADDAVFVGAFQAGRFWRQSQTRWRHIAARSDLVVALAVLPKSAHRNNVWQVGVPGEHPLAREWAVVCDSPAFSACVAGVERPGSDDAARPRRFEALWTVDPVTVRDAASAATLIATSREPALAEHLPERLRRPATVGYDTVLAAASLTNRIVAYLDGKEEKGRPG